jgi:hypothetical protein
MTLGKGTRDKGKGKRKAEEDGAANSSVAVLNLLVFDFYKE